MPSSRMLPAETVIELAAAGQSGKATFAVCVVSGECDQVPYVESGLEAVIFTADGDMRQALNNLQVLSCTMAEQQ